MLHIFFFFLNLNLMIANYILVYMQMLYVLFITRALCSNRVWLKFFSRDFRRKIVIIVRIYRETKRRETMTIIDKNRLYTCVALLLLTARRYLHNEFYRRIFVCIFARNKYWFGRRKQKEREKKCWIRFRTIKITCKIEYTSENVCVRNNFFFLTIEIKTGSV